MGYLKTQIKRIAFWFFKMNIVQNMVKHIAKIVVENMVILIIHGVNNV
jgi:hypothetical protein